MVEITILKRTVTTAGPVEVDDVVSVPNMEARYLISIGRATGEPDPAGP